MPKIEMITIEIGSRWRSVDGKVATIDFVKNDLVVWTYKVNNHEEMTRSSKIAYFLFDFKELKRR